MFVWFDWFFKLGLLGDVIRWSQKVDKIREFLPSDIEECDCGGDSSTSRKPTKPRVLDRQLGSVQNESLRIGIFVEYGLHGWFKVVLEEYKDMAWRMVNPSFILNDKTEVISFLREKGFDKPELEAKVNKYVFKPAW